MNRFDVFDMFIKKLNLSCILQIRSNALIKRGSLRMQNEERDLALSDFASAAEQDVDNSDIYHHRGQVGLLGLSFLDSHPWRANPSSRKRRSFRVI